MMRASLLLAICLVCGLCGAAPATAQTQPRRDYTYDAAARKLTLPVTAAALALTATVVLVATPDAAQTQVAAPAYEVDVSWPKPLPNQWVLGGLGGVCVDNQDHVFILNRQDVLEPDLNAGRMAPLIIELDPSGEVVNSWGDPALLDERLHSCHADNDNNIWMASSPSGMIQK